jgi:transaldolase
MKATQLLHHLGQSLWFDNITRNLLDNGTVQQAENATQEPAA